MHLSIYLELYRRLRPDFCTRSKGPMLQHGQTRAAAIGLAPRKYKAPRVRNSPPHQNTVFLVEKESAPR